MDFGEASYLPFALDGPAFGIPDEQSVLEAIERLEPFLKGQGYLPIGGELRIINANAEQASQVLELISRLASQHQVDDRAREQLRDQADKDRVALAHAQKRIETLEEGGKRLTSMVKDLEGKLLAAKHKAEEQERDLKQKLQSTTVRLNGYLYGGRDAGKRGAAAAMASSGPGGARRVAPAYDRFQDDPAEAAASAQKREAELTQLRQQNLRLQKDLAAARKQLDATTGVHSTASGASPQRDGLRFDQEGVSERSPGDRQHGNSMDMRSVRNALSDVAGGHPISPTSPDAEVARLQRLVRDLQLNVEHLQRTKVEMQRQLDKASAERSELHKTLHSLRSKCASLEVERRNAEDRVLRAQRATAALLDPAAAEAQTLELKAKLAAAERERHMANARADGLKQQLAVAEADVEANQRHVEILKRAVRVMPKGQQGLEQLEALVSEELKPLHERLRKATEELEQARAELEQARAQCTATADAGQQPCDGAALGATVTSLAISSAGPSLLPEDNQPPQGPADGLPLSPAVPLPTSPTARFNGFTTRPAPANDSPPLLLQPPPTHAFYSRAFSSTMPVLHSESMIAGSSSFPKADDGSNALQQGQQQPQWRLHFDGQVVSTGGGTQPGSVGAATSGSPYMRRSVSAGVSYRMGEQYISAERQRARWQVHNPQARQRFPSPIDIIMEQARNHTAADATISIRTPIPEGHPGSSSQGSTP